MNLLQKLFFNKNLIRNYSVRVRFAPSPTGNLHLGGFRTALFNYIFAHKHSGQFILRIEDTDQSRAVPGTSEQLEEDLAWLKISPSESPLKGGSYGPYVQSKRLDLYKEEVERLIELGHAYPCFCTEKRIELLRKDALRRKEVIRYDGKCRNLTESEIRARIKDGVKYCVRFKHPPPPYIFNDIVFGPITIDVEQGDFVIMKSDGFPTYHLASVVDDHHMEISHILRGVEWQVSTGKHLAIYKALDYKPPLIAHLPLILNKDGSKLSKRQGDISIESYRNRKYYPEALVNFVMGSRTQIKSIDSIANEFELESLSTSSNKLDFAYLEDLNQLCLRKKIDSSILELRELLPGESEEFYRRVLKWCPDRISKLPDLLTEFPFISKDFIPPKLVKDNEIQIIQKVIIQIENDSFIINTENFKEIAERNKMPVKDFMHLLRKSLCGTDVGPPVAEVINLFGKQESIMRLKKSIL